MRNGRTVFVRFVSVAIFCPHSAFRVPRFPRRFPLRHLDECLLHHIPCGIEVAHDAARVADERDARSGRAGRG